MKKIRIYLATIKDSKDIWLWRNDKTTIFFSKNKKKINFKNHDFWFSKSLKEDDIDLNSVLPRVNLLISDFSGAIIDFLFLNKPIILYTPDLSDYKRDPGLAVDIFKSSFFYKAYSVKNVFNHLKVFLNKPKKFSDFHSNSRKKNINKFIKNKDPFKLIIDRLQN